MCFPKLNHQAPEDKPGEVADAALRFFAAHSQQAIGEPALTAH
jgi:hypothetical protein